MKKVIFSAAVLGLMAICNTGFAQDEKLKEEKIEKMKEKEKDYKKSQEIIIRKKGDKDAKIIVEVNGDKITVNGKPLSEFKDDNITINKRNVTVWDNRGNKTVEMVPGEFMNSFNWDSNEGNHAFLGVTTKGDDEDSENNKSTGAEITNITKESAAEKAGLKVGDMITKVDDKKIGGPQDLTDVISDKKPKDEVTIYYKRDGKENQSKAILGERKGMSYSFATPNPRTYSYSLPKIETDLSPLYSPRSYDGLYGELLPRHQKLGLSIQDTEDGEGVKVLDVNNDSPAETAGLKKGDIITEVGGKKVKNTDEARDLLKEYAEKGAYKIKAKRNGTELNFDIKIPKKLKTANL